MIASKQLFACVGTAGVFVMLAFTAAAVATAGPSSPVNAQAAIDQLKAQGYHVIITKSGNGDVKECTVKSINQLSAITDVEAARNVRNRPTTTPTAGRKTAYVTLAC
ncbi:hypothetical protein [Mycobacteroides salmoniphilum]|uniref:hypothetical protein n=1 Tax=Mycobacteroides salmoniphilum TaxID=404941 RepID=UPI0010D050EF|nr:hypothetical protein [Mycobacteroides salmoniphilum]TDZ91641.1 hypothetical protein CCUG62472_03538 [Mycobacteroides salmoniphilum]